MLSQNPVHSEDEQMLDQAIAEFLRAEAAGEACNRQQWLDRYTACAECLAEFFEDRDRVNRLILPVRLDRHVAAYGGDSTDLFSPHDVQLASGQGTSAELCPEPPILTSTRYRPLTFHARGGMGEIWLAKDERIGRHVAVKKLRSGRETQQARFFIEAQITGQLEHPSVVPLHDIGLDDRGNPFYVMKFIRGRRLKDAIGEFHAQKSNADWPSDLEFRRLLETFVSVCNVVAFAHDKGVLHRDIKPDNVMIGPYGETVLVDWGLAKVVGEADDEEASAVRLSGSGSTATQDGAIIGSPLYMSPEGAKGRPEAVDQASDVYLLGATLYEMLCNRPPRQANSSWELINLALHSRPVSPRTIDRRIPRSLEAICLKALAFEKRDRYQSPLELAEDVERYLAGAPTAAYREPLWIRAGRWMKRHRRALLHGLAAALLILLGVFSVHSFREARLLGERERAREQFADFYRLADEAQYFAANTDAVSERVPYYDPRRALQAGEMAMAVAAPWSDRAQSLPIPDERADFDRAQHALLLLMAQSTLQAANSEDAARRALALLDQTQLVQPLSRGYHLLRSQCLTRLGDSRAAEAELYRANAPEVTVTAQDYFVAGELLRLKDAGASASALGDQESVVRREHLDAAVQEYRRALDTDPRHYWSRFQLGRCLLALGRGPEAIEALSACVALRPSSPWAYSTRGLANAIFNRPSEALRDLDQALRLDPAFQPARLNRGIVHWLDEKPEAALADLSAILATPDDTRLLEAAYYRGQILLDERRDREARADFTSVIAARPEFRPAYWFRAKTQFRQGGFDAGLLDVNQFLALDDRHARIANTAEQYLILGKALRKIAQELDDVARTTVLRAAEAKLQSAIDAGPPTVEMWKQLGAVRDLLGQYGAAVEAYSEGLALDASVPVLRNMRGWAYVNQNEYGLAQADFAEVVRNAPKDADAHSSLGFVMAQLNRDAAAHYEASIALLRGADNHLVLHNVACIFGRLSAQSEKKIETENLALATLERAIAISQQNPIRRDADALVLIRNEKSFPESLRSRPEFQRLLSRELNIPQSAGPASASQRP